MKHYISGTTQGETCTICESPATHKVGEELPHDEPKQTLSLSGQAHLPVSRHNFTAYVCCEHFKQIFGRAVFCDV